MEAADPAFNAILTGYANDIMARSHRMMSGDYDARSLWARLFDSLCWLMSPYI